MKSRGARTHTHTALFFGKCAKAAATHPSSLIIISGTRPFSLSLSLCQDPNLAAAIAEADVVRDETESDEEDEVKA